MGDSEKNYNHVFEKLHDVSESQLVALVAYGYYKENKREWINAQIKKNDKPPTPNELKIYVSSVSTEGQLDLLVREAQSSLAEFYNIVLENNMPEIRNEIETTGMAAKLETGLADLRSDLSPSIGKQVVSSIIGGFAYSAVLVVIYLIIRIFGADFATLAEALKSSA